MNPHHPHRKSHTSGRLEKLKPSELALTIHPRFFAPPISHRILDNHPAYPGSNVDRPGPFFDFYPSSPVNSTWLPLPTTLDLPPHTLTTDLPPICPALPLPLTTATATTITVFDHLPPASHRALPAPTLPIAAEVPSPPTPSRLLLSPPLSHPM